MQTLTADGSSGAWSVTATPLAQGQYTAVASQSDTGGNTGFSAPATFIVDSTAPTIAMTFPAAAGSYNLATWNAGCSPVGVCGTAADAAPGSVASVAVTVQRASDGLYWNGTAWVGGVQTLTPTGATAWKLALAAANLTQGSYTVTARATDTAGNQSTLLSRTFTVDLTPPVVTVTAPATGSSTNDTTPTLSGTCTDRRRHRDRGREAGATTVQTKTSACSAAGAWTVDAARP